MTRYIFTYFFLFISLIRAQSFSQVGSDLDGEALRDSSGISISLSANGKRLAIGAIHNDGNGNKSGHARIFSESGGAWTQVGSDIDGEAAGDLFGTSISLSNDGKRVAIGGIYNNASGVESGHVRVYSEAGGTWAQIGSDIDGEAAGDHFGSSVFMSGDGSRVAIGAVDNDGSASSAGSVRVFSESGGAWSQVGSDIDGEAANDWFGLSVSLSDDGKRVAVGGPLNDGSATDAGHVKVYSESGGVWSQIGSDIDGEGLENYSGASVSLSADGTRLAIGAPGNSGTGASVGHVRVYSESGGAWSQVGSDIDGEAAFDFSGSVSLSSDGKRLAIGAPLNDGSATDAGHVRIYSESGGAWSQVGSDLDGEIAVDLSGFSVSLSSDGNRVAIGAPYNDGNGPRSGHVRVYVDDSSVPVELTNFIVEKHPDGVICHWATETEFENLGFLLERRSENDSWTKIASYKTNNLLLGQGTTSMPTNYSYIDKLVDIGILYEYRLSDIDYNGNITSYPTKYIEIDSKQNSSIIDSFSLLPAHPNPFNPNTTITYKIKNAGNVKISIYNISGKLVKHLMNEEQQSGWHNIDWDGTDHLDEIVSAGIYIIKVSYNTITKTIKVNLNK